MKPDENQTKWHDFCSQSIAASVCVHEVLQQVFPSTGSVASVATSVSVCCKCCNECFHFDHKALQLHNDGISGARKCCNVLQWWSLPNSIQWLEWFGAFSSKTLELIGQSKRLHFRCMVACCGEQELLPHQVLEQVSLSSLCHMRKWSGGLSKIMLDKQMIAIFLQRMLFSCVAAKWIREDKLIGNWRCVGMFLNFWQFSFGHHMIILRVDCVHEGWNDGQAFQLCNISKDKASHEGDWIKNFQKS